jgi:hypothetical protein
MANIDSALVKGPIPDFRSCRSMHPSDQDPKFASPMSDDLWSAKGTYDIIEAAYLRVTKTI